ncbi:hypothetical protein HYS00_04895, partial [Candidatus Microgenomates bacterium]|nr:hypothetical protein [Candidatus Microgenomates bacterium]
MLKKAGIIILLTLILVTVLAQQHKLNFNFYAFQPKTHKPQGPPLAINEYSDSGQVLAEKDTKDGNFADTIYFNIPAVFKKDITAPNIVYGLNAGPGITISGDKQNPIISSDAAGGVTSIGGAKGDIVFTGGTGITVAGNTFTNTGVTSIQGSTGSVSLEAGSGITIEGLKISSSASSAASNSFETISVSGQSDVVAGSSTDTLTLVSGTGITITTDATNKKVTITGSSTTDSGFTDDGTTVRLSTATDAVGVGTTSPNAKLEVVKTTEQLRLGYDASNYLSFTVNSSGVATLAPSGGTLAITGSATISGNTTLGDATTDRITFTGQVAGGTPLVFQGATDNSFTTSLAFADPSTNNTITFPDSTGTVCLSSGNCGGSGTGAPADAQYLTLATNSTLTNERVATAGTNISLTDAGANGNLTIAVINNPTFSGLTTMSGGYTTSRTLSADSGSTQNTASITYASPADTTGTNVSQGFNISPTIGNATGGTNTANVINIADVTGDAQVSLNAIKVGALTGTAATETAINIGAGWDSVLTVNGTSVINGSGQIATSQLTGTLFTFAGDSGSGAVSQGNTVSVVGGGNGIDTSESGTTITVTLDTTEIGTTTFGSGSGFSWTFDSTGGTDPIVAFGNSSIAVTAGTSTFSGNLGVGTTNPAAALSVGSSSQFQVNSSGAVAAATGITSSGTIVFSGLGTGYVKSTSGTLSVGSTIPSSDVSGTLFTAAGDSGSGSVVQGNTFTVSGSGNGIDTSESGTAVTVSLDTTEIANSTFGSGSGFTWTFDSTSGTDTSI